MNMELLTPVLLKQYERGIITLEEAFRIVANEYASVGLQDKAIEAVKAADIAAEGAHS